MSSSTTFSSSSTFPSKPAADIKTQGIALSMHTTMAIIAVLGVYYILKSHWFLAICAAGGVYAAKQYPRWSSYIALAIFAPIALFWVGHHWFLSLLTVGIALLAYSMADEGTKTQLHEAAMRMAGPLGENIKVAKDNVMVTAVNTAEKVDDKIRTSIPTGQSTAQTAY